MIVAGEYTEAKTWFAELYSRYPDNQIVLYELIRVGILLGDYKDLNVLYPLLK